MARLGKGRVVRHVAVETKTAEPPIGQVQVDFLAQPPFRANAEAVAHDQHADQQLGINRWPPHFHCSRAPGVPECCRVRRSGRSRAADASRARDVQARTRRTERVVGLSDPPSSTAPSRRDFRKSDYYTMTDPMFFNTIHPSEPFAFNGEIDRSRTLCGPSA